jgi:ATP-binding cassette subfamily F protein uup
MVAQLMSEKSIYHTMNHLSVENLSKSFGLKKLFKNVTFGLNQGDKVALVATNGKGKSTLLKMIMGIESCDTGEVSVNKEIKACFLEQEPKVDDTKTIIEEIFSIDDPVIQLVKRYIDVSKNHPESEEMGDLVTQMTDYNAWDVEARVQEVLTNLKLTDFDQIVGLLSGGQKKRLGLAKVILENPDFLLLDEPTNHLDVDVIEWLEKYLMTSKMTLLMVTHDRYFLELVCTHIIELTDNGIDKYEGNFSLYLENKALRQEQEQREVAKAKNLFRSELEWIRRQPKARGTKSKYRVERFDDIKAKAHSLKEETKLELLQANSRQGKKILEADNASIYFDEQCFLDKFSYIFQRNEKLGIIGPNGVGKSTFLNALVGELPLTSGEITSGINTKFGYYRQHSAELPAEERVIDVVKKVGEFLELANGEKITASKLLERFLFDGNMQYSKVSTLSGGEKKRLQLLLVLVANPNFLILDEPTNDLDVQTLAVLEDYLLNFGGCLLIVSHDRYFLDKVVGRYFVFEGNGKTSEYVGKYTEYLEFKKEKDSEKRKEKTESPTAQKVKDDEKKLSYKEKLELEALDRDIADINTKIIQIETELTSCSDNQKIVDLSSQHQKLKDKLDEMELRWLEINEG